MQRFTKIVSKFMLNILLARILKIAMENWNGATSLQTEHELWEYLLVASPAKEVFDKIVDEKKFFYENYGHKLANQTKPHITIANFLAKEEMEVTLIRWIQNVCNLHNSFTVTLNNYSGFPPHTIYLRIQNVEPFKKLANALKILDSFIQSNDCPPLELVSKPHLTIARQLPEFVYETAIKDYAQKIFHESFKVEKLILLKRDAYMKCHLINTFILPPPLTLFD
jgi:2'-5' RNA ligase